METGTAINVKYWVASDQGRNFSDLDGIDEFRRELAADYVCVVKGRPAGAGGFTHLNVEVISSFFPFTSGATVNRWDRIRRNQARR